MTVNTSLDGILNRRVMLEQPVAGYRIAIDTVLLAAAVPAVAEDRVLDMGCGVGGAILALAYRVKGIKGMGIDIQPELIEMFRRNIARNPNATGLQVRVGDAAALGRGDDLGAFDLVMANPPYHEEAKHDASPDKIKQIANHEKDGNLPQWIQAAATVLRDGGVFTLINRADRRNEILMYLRSQFGEIEVLPLLSKDGGEVKRLIFRARKGAAYAVRDCKPFILHKPEGGYTPEADAVLREVQPLTFQSP
jgi:tRNA1(Val) A37 N6-methylase TrmN6